MSNASIIPPKLDPFGLFRLLTFERRGWRKAISDSEIPVEAQELVAKVVKKSRLLRFEKFDVIQELVAHFVDGERSGKSVGQLIADFGDPIVTAQLIHQSKKRNRPIMFKVAKIFGWFLLALTSFYVVLLGYFHAAAPTPNTDFMVDLNRPNVEANEHDKAWPIYRPAWTKHELSEGGTFDWSPFYHPEGDVKHSRYIQPGDAGWPNAIARLEEISDLLDAMREGATKSVLGLELHANPSNYPLDDFKALFPNAQLSDFEPPNSADTNSTDALMADTVVGVLLPHLQSFRRIANVFQIDTRWAVEQNDPDRALENLETMFGLARHATDTNVLVGSLVGIAISGIAFDTIQEVLVEHPDFFDDKQLTRLQQTVVDISVNDWIKFDGERAFFHDIVQRIYSDDGEGDGRITPTGVKLFSQFSGLIAPPKHKATISGSERVDRFASAAQSAIAPAALFVMASRSELTSKANEYYDFYENAVQQPRWDRPRSDVEEFLDQNHIRFAILGSFFPAFDNVIDAMDKTIARQEAVIAAIASQRFFAANGRWPSEVVELAPDFVTELPVDLMTGNPIPMIANDSGVTFYSYANDLDDDQGKPVQAVYGNRNAPIFRTPVKGNPVEDGDWVLWPSSDKATR